MAEAEVLQVEVHWEIFRPEHPDTLTSMSNLGFTHQLLGRTVEAAVLQGEALKKQKILGLDHPKTLTSMQILALI